MKLIKPSVIIVPQLEGLRGAYKQIEIGGRTCYLSNDKITEESAKEFVDRMISSKHFSMLEHGTIYLKCEVLFEGQTCVDINDSSVDFIFYFGKLGMKGNPYSRVKLDIQENNKFIRTLYITTNMRVLVENNRLYDLKYICEPTEYHEKRVMAKFTTQIAVSREANRHRVNSIAESSTRNVNFSKDKFGNEIAVNLPTFIDENDINSNMELGDYCEAVLYRQDEDSFSIIDYWMFANLAAEYSYMNMIRLGCRAEQARIVLPLDTNTIFCHTAFVDDWKHFFDLRCSNACHPDFKILALDLQRQFKDTNLI